MPSISPFMTYCATRPAFMAAVLAWFSLADGRDYVLDAQSRIRGSDQDRHDRSAWTDGRAQPVEYL